MHGLLLRHGDTAFLDAAKQSLAADLFGAEYVSHHLADASSMEVSR